MSLLPLQVNQGYLIHYNIIINEEHYIYVGDMHLRYVLFVEHVMLPIIMGQLHGETNPSLIYILEEIIEKVYIYIYI